jgi:thiol-disulfide isomerase/thioredoxin
MRAIRHSFATIASLFALMLFTFSRTVAAETITARVLNERDQPIADCQLQVTRVGEIGQPWTKATNGVVALWDDFSGVGITHNVPTILTVRASGFASSLQQLDSEAVRKINADRSTTIHLKPGRTVKIQFRLPQGMELKSEIAPEIYFQSCQENARAMRNSSNRETSRKSGLSTALDMNMLNARRVENGAFELQLSEDTPPFMVAIHQPGFLQSFEAGPFTLADFKDGALTIEIPKPAQVAVDFDVSAVATKDRDFQSASAFFMQRIPGRSDSYFELQRAPEILDGQVRVADLPPGHYMVYVGTVPKDNPVGRTTHDATPGKFTDSAEFDLAAGEQKSVQFHYKLLNLTAFRGTRSALLRFETASGKPAAERNVSVTLGAKNYGPIPVFTGKTLPSGELEIKNLSGAKEHGDSYGPYTVDVDGNRAGTFELSGDDPAQHFSLRVRPEAGDLAPEIEFLNVASGNNKKLSDLHGKLVLVEFWAIWCGPCQSAMDHLNQVAGENAALWKDKLEVVAISCDDDARRALEHAQKRGWNNLTTYWSGAEGESDWKAPAMRVFDVHGIPESILIDRNGKILWRGHPLGQETTALEACIKTELEK